MSDETKITIKNDIVPMLETLYNRLSANTDRALIAEIHAQYLDAVQNFEQVYRIMQAFSTIAEEFKFQRDVLANENDDLRRLNNTRIDALAMLAEVCEVDEMTLQRGLMSMTETNITEDTEIQLRDAILQLVEEQLAESVEIE